MSNNPQASQATGLRLAAETQVAAAETPPPRFWARMGAAIRSTWRWPLHPPAGFRIVENICELTPAEFQRLEALAYEHGANFLSYCSIEPDRSWVVMGDFEGVVGFVRTGRYLHLTGAPLCSETVRERMYQGLMTLALENKLILSIQWIERSEAEYFQARGWDAVAVGRDCRIPLTECTWKGADYSWLRRQENYCVRQGLVVREVVPSELPSEEWQTLRDELLSINHEHLAPKTFHRQLRCWEGHPFDGEFGRRRLFIASEKGSTKTSAFLCCNPCKGGTQWSFEMYRSRPGAVRGVIPFLMLQTLRQLQKEGAVEVDLCPVPAILDRFDWTPKQLLTNYVLWAWRTCGNMFFDVHGIYHFRSRFRPRNDDCFRVDFPHTTAGVLFTFPIAAEMWRINLKNLLRACWDMLTKRKSLVTIPQDPADTPVPEAAPAAAQKQSDSRTDRKVA